MALDFLAKTGSRAAVFTDLLAASQQQVADRWHVGTATSRDEYRISVAIASTMAVLPPARHAPSSDTACALLATMAPERHDLGMRLVAMALEDDGWDVEVAPAIGLEELVDAVGRNRVDLVGLSSTYDHGGIRPQLASAVAALHAVNVPVILGGLACIRAPRLAEEVGADAMGEDARVAVILARRLRRMARQRLVGARARHRSGVSKNLSTR